MYNVSDKYKQEIKSSFRNETEMRIYIGLFNQDSYETASLVDAVGQGSYTIDLNELLDDGRELKNLITLETHRLLLDGNTDMEFGYSESEKFGSQFGLISNEISSGDGLIPKPTYIEFAWSELVTLSGLFVLFDALVEEYSDMHLIAKNGDNVVIDTNITPDRSDYAYRGSIEEIDYMKLEMLNTSLPDRFARLNYISFGFRKTISGDILVDSTVTNGISPISDALPDKSLSFSFLDSLNEFDPLSKTSLYNFIQDKQPVVYEYIQTLSDGTTEIIPGGKMYTTGEVSVNGVGIKTVSLVAKPYFSMMTGIGSLGYIKDKNLQYAFEKLAKGGNWSPDNKKPYDVTHTGNYTKSMLDTGADYNNIWQKLCHSDNDFIFIDRADCVTPKPLFRPVDDEIDFRFTFRDMLNPPTVSTLPQMKDLLLQFYNVRLQDEQEILNFPAGELTNGKRRFVVDVPMADGTIYLKATDTTEVEVPIESDPGYEEYPEEKPDVLTVNIEGATKIINGGNGEFVVEVSGGSYDYTYQWYRNDKPITEGTDDLWTTGKLTYKSQGARYYCEVTDTETGDVVKSSELVVLIVDKLDDVTTAIPGEMVFEMWADNPTIVSGGKVTFNTKIRNSKGSVERYYWYRDGSVTPVTTSSYKTGTLSEASNGAVYSVKVKFSGDSTLYEAKASVKINVKSKTKSTMRMATPRVMTMSEPLRVMTMSEPPVVSTYTESTEPDTSIKIAPTTTGLYFAEFDIPPNMEMYEFSLMAKPYENVPSEIKTIGMNKYGTDCIVENDFNIINDPEEKNKYILDMIRYYSLPATFEFSNRGFPELDVGDIVRLNTQYGDLKGVIIKNDITYGGTLGGTTTIMEYGRIEADKLYSGQIYSGDVLLIGGVV